MAINYDLKNYRPVIGLEIHVELKTKSKMFCQCSADYFGKKANTNVCPVCLGLPGALPVPNKKAIEWTILIGKALNCKINLVSKFDRKHYFYPDLPKGYQISQYDQPFCQNGFLDIYPEKSDNLEIALKERKRFRIRRVHLEEDTGKLIHQGNETLINFNRSGVPLVEIVTEPDFSSSLEVKRFLEELQIVLRYLNVSDCDMEKGTMRLEPNISVRKILNSNHPIPSRLPSYKVEVKNINSFRFVKQAIDYEIKRQIEVLEKGENPRQETRGFDEKKGITYSQRLKEEAQDYRYFPDPDIPPIIFENEDIDLIKVPQLPWENLINLVKNFSLRYIDAFILTRDFNLLNYFLNLTNEIKKRRIKELITIEDLHQKIANLIINKKTIIELNFDEVINKIKDAFIVSPIDEGLLEKVVKKVIINNSKAVSDYHSGKENALMFLTGQVMKETKGKVKAIKVIEKLKTILSNK